jgi:hypothetical protein
METSVFTPDQNYEYTKVEVFDNILNQKLFEFYVNESRFFYAWLTVKSVDYLICAEDVFGGQTVVDLTDRKMVGYSSGEDGYIWTNFHLSPNGNKLATIGCYWGSSYFIRLFDFSEPMNLPLRQLEDIELLGNDEVIVSWIDNSTLQMKGIKREYETEYFEGGSMRHNIVSEIPIERRITINGT